MRRHTRSFRRPRGQATVEYALLIGIISAPFSYGIWYVFFHPAPGHSQGRLVEFMSLVIDFARW